MCLLIKPHRHRIMRSLMLSYEKWGWQHHTVTELYACNRRRFFLYWGVKTTLTPNNLLADALFMRNGGRNNTTQTPNYTLSLADAFLDEKQRTTPHKQQIMSLRFFFWEKWGNTTPTPNNALTDAFSMRYGGATPHQHQIISSRLPMPFLIRNGGQHHNNTE